MRRKDREVTDISELMDIISECKVCRLGLIDELGIYIVPLNFGYTYKDSLTLYFHSAKSGRKIDAIAKNPNVCFEMDCSHNLISGEVACQYGYNFRSIIGNGKAELIIDNTQKGVALEQLMKHQTGKDFVFDSKMVESVTVFKVEVSSFCGKDICKKANPI